MPEGSNASSGGIGTLGLLGVAFIVLKLCHVIDWSWWYITLPLWGPVALVAAIVLPLGVIWIILRIQLARERKRDFARRGNIEQVRERLR